ncbi:MAG: adenylate kinase, partial [Oscillospiraceae bacterium]
ICDVCGGELILRSDDTLETVRHRLEIYHKETEPLKGFYESRGVLRVVHNQPTIDATSRVVLQTLGL